MFLLFSLISPSTTALILVQPFPTNIDPFINFFTINFLGLTSLPPWYPPRHRFGKVYLPYSTSHHLRLLWSFFFTTDSFSVSDLVHVETSVSFLSSKDAHHFLSLSRFIYCGRWKVFYEDRRNLYFFLVSPVLPYHYAGTLISVPLKVFRQCNETDNRYGLQS